MERLIALWESPSVREIAWTIAAVVVVLVLARVLRRVSSRYIDDKDVRYRVRKAIASAGYVVAVLVVVGSLSGKMSGLTVALGAASAGIAFSLKELIASIAGWVALSFGSFFRVGDRIQLGGIVGDVIDIGMLRTTMMECGGWVKADLYNGRIVRVANSSVFKEPVYNYSADFPYVWDEFTVPVKYGSDYALARKILQGIADEVTAERVAGAKEPWLTTVRKYRVEDARLEPVVTVVANDNWVEFTVRYVTHFRERRMTKDQLFTRILPAFDETKGLVGFASATFQLVEAPVFNVRMEAPPAAS